MFVGARQFVQDSQLALQACRKAFAGTQHSMCRAHACSLQQGSRTVLKAKLKMGLPGSTTALDTHDVERYKWQLAAELSLQLSSLCS